MHVTSFSIIILAVSQCLCLERFEVKNENNKRQATFEGGNYTVQWEVDFETKTIFFNVSAKTTGYVGLGLSHTAGMTGADIVIGGILPNGSSYFANYHGVGNKFPVLNTKQNWNLTMATQSNGQTTLQFSRRLDTCDDINVAITADTLYIIWAYGKTDKIEYHGSHRGAAATNILDPPLPPLNMSGISTWKIGRDVVMPSEDTSYLCTIHRKPQFASEQFIVGFSIKLFSREALKHSHHITMYKCTPPKGRNAEGFFGPLEGQPPTDCYTPKSFPLEHCLKILYVWAIGGTDTIFPGNVGYRINKGSGEFYMFEVHYDNPEKLVGVKVATSLEIYHTSHPREHEAELLTVFHAFLPTHLIPPHSKRFVTVGHCSSECTNKRIPPNGISVFNVLLHSHMAGRELTVRHFRKGKELPWLASDRHFDFNYQQTRPLRQFVKILSGDQLALECVTDTSDRSNATLAGLSTKHEMCEAILWYYPKQNFTVCGSYYDNLRNLLDTFQIADANWNSSDYDPIVIAPLKLAGKPISQVASEYPWTTESRDKWQQAVQYEPHGTMCVETEDTSWKSKSKVTYENISETYVPHTDCKKI